MSLTTVQAMADTNNDFEVIDNHHIRLRAERAANGNGRIYKILVTADDGCNSITKDSIEVRVVHNINNPQSGKPFIVGSTVNFGGDFWDKPANKHTAKWLIDDNTTVKAIVTEPQVIRMEKSQVAINSPHQGVYKLQMNVTDQTWLNTLYKYCW
jgi:hypothetical protein